MTLGHGPFLDGGYSLHLQFSDCVSQDRDVCGHFAGGLFIKGLCVSASNGVLASFFN
jgi:hypothetical protein